MCITNSTTNIPHNQKDYRKENEDKQMEGKETKESKVKGPVSRNLTEDKPNSNITGTQDEPNVNPMETETKPFQPTDWGKVSA